MQSCLGEGSRSTEQKIQSSPDWERSGERGHGRCQDVMSRVTEPAADGDLLQPRAHLLCQQLKDQGSEIYMGQESCIQL